jgi:hypothetical protein
MEPKTFREVLLSWGNTWIWDHLTIIGGDRWVYKSIKDGTLVAVTDSSYMRELSEYVFGSLHPGMQQRPRTNLWRIHGDYGGSKR